MPVQPISLLGSSFVPYAHQYQQLFFGLTSQKVNELWQYNVLYLLHFVLCTEVVRKRLHFAVWLTDFISVYLFLTACTTKTTIWLHFKS